MRPAAEQPRPAITPTIPSPVKGLDFLTPLENADPQTATILDNCMCGRSAVRARRGSEAHVTNIQSGAEVRSLMSYNGASIELFAATGTDIYDVTSAGSAPSSALGSLSSGDWNYINMTNSGGVFLFACNGSDTPIIYNGTSWAAGSFTGPGLTASNWNYVTVHKERAWMVEKGTLNAWYLATQSVQGAATEFPLGAVFEGGGELVAIGSFSQDSGSGPDDFLCFLTDRGEIAVYQGTNPASASTWALIGTFKTAEPVGIRPLFRWGGDLAIITTDGIFTMKLIFQADAAQLEFVALTTRISPRLNDLARSFKSEYGWSAAVHASGDMIVLNVPNRLSSRAFQYVFSIETGGWTRFTGWDANQFVVSAETLYYCTRDGKVIKGDTGYQDQGEPYEVDLKTAWQFFGERAAKKQNVMVQPLLLSNGIPQFGVKVDEDFGEKTPPTIRDATTQISGAWDTGLWDTAQWSTSVQVVNKWKTAPAIGRALAVRFKASINGSDLTISAFNMHMRAGGIL